MKAKKKKQYKKQILFYQRSFGFKVPITVLVDTDFCAHALKYRYHLKDSFSTWFDCGVRIAVTKCTIENTRALGEDHSGTAIAMKRFEIKKCNHDEPVATEECIRSFIGSENREKCVVATQLATLREALRYIPGVPLFYGKRDNIIFEPTSTASYKKAKEHESVKFKKPTDEISQLSEALGINIPTPQEPSKKMPKRRKAKAPNPLSVKKKKN